MGVCPSGYYLHFQLATGKVPYSQLSEFAVVVKVSKGRRPSKPPLQSPGNVQGGLEDRQEVLARESEGATGGRDRPPVS